MSFQAHNAGAAVPVQAKRGMTGGYYGHSLIIPEPPLMVLPSLAQFIGLERAIVYQQLFFLFLNPDNGRVINGHRWIYNTYKDWQSVFPFWEERTIRRLFTEMEVMMLVESCQPEGVLSRRKYYRLNSGMLQKLKKGEFELPVNSVNSGKLRCGQTRRIDRPNEAHPITETTSIDYESKESCLTTCEQDFEALIDLKLKTARTPKNIPKDRNEFEIFISDNSLFGIIDKRDIPKMYDEFVDKKWHEVKGGKLKPIRYWKKYLIALNEILEGN